MSRRPPITRVLSKLDGVQRSGGGWEARCPVHDDRDPSLNISEGKDGRVLLFCHAGCETEDVVANLGLNMSDLFTDNQKRGKTIRQTYDYTDEAGKLLFQVVRYEPKDFRQRRPDGRGGWIPSVAGIRRVPYRLPNLIEAVKRKETVFVVEGEKDVDSLRDKRLAATTNSGGAGKWRPEYNESLRGAHVVILPDNDEVGREHARRVAHSLSGTAAEVRIVELPGLKPGGDVSDWLSNGGTRKKLKRLVASAPTWNPDTHGGQASNPEERFHLLSADEVERTPKQKYLLEGMIPLGGLCEMHGPAGAGKSFLALDLCCTVATGGPWFGRIVHQGPAVYVVAEGSSGLGGRLRAWRQHHRFSGVPDVHFLTKPVQLLDNKDVSAFIGALNDLPTPPVLIVLDTLARCLVNGDENAAKDMGLAIAAADRIRHATGATVLLIHHTRKDRSDERGSSALRGAVDAMMAVKGDGSSLRIWCEKMKDGPEFDCPPLGLIPVGESCVVGTADAAAMLRGDELSSKERQALESLLSNFSEGGASTTEWLKATGLPPRTFYNVRTPLLHRDLVEMHVTGRKKSYSVSVLGKASLTARCQTRANAVPENDDKMPASRPPLRGRQHGSHGSHRSKDTTYQAPRASQGERAGPAARRIRRRSAAKPRRQSRRHR